MGRSSGEKEMIPLHAAAVNGDIVDDSE